MRARPSRRPRTRWRSWRRSRGVALDREVADLGAQLGDRLAERDRLLRVDAWAEDDGADAAVAVLRVGDAAGGRAGRGPRVGHRDAHGEPGPVRTRGGDDAGREGPDAR